MVTRKDFLDRIAWAMSSVLVGNIDGEGDVQSGLRSIKDSLRHATDAGNKTMIIGNGGSAAIASHIAIDYAKNGGFRAVACNDLAALTCLSNDFGYEQVFAKQIEQQGRAGDVAILISSSGKSPNILLAAQAARHARFDAIYTLSGMGADNPLRSMGHMNFYVPSDDYGIVEITHLALLHSIVSVP